VRTDLTSWEIQRVDLSAKWQPEALILAKYQVSEDIRQQRRRSKRRKANSFGIQEKEETVIGRIYEAAEAPQPAATKPSPDT
jgi:hypothetical protein